MTEVLEATRPQAVRLTELAQPDLPSIDNGDALRAGREAAGVGPRAAAEALRLSIEQLLALENEQWERLPGRPYVRAVLRAYARRLGVDATPLIERVGGFAEPAVLAPLPEATPVAESSLVAGSRRSQTGRGDRTGRSTLLDRWLGTDSRASGSLAGRAGFGSHRSRGWLPIAAGVGVLGLLVGLVAILMVDAGPVVGNDQIEQVAIPSANRAAPRAAPAEAGAHPQNGSPSSSGGIGLSTVPMTIGAGSLGMAAIAVERSEAPRASRSVDARAPEVAGTESPSASKTVAPSARRAPATTTFPVQPSGPETVHLHFSKRAWVDIRHKDGEKLLIGEQAANGSVTVKGVPPMQIVIGNPNGVKIEFRGEVVDLKPRTNSKGIAKFTLK